MSEIIDFRLARARRTAAEALRRSLDPMSVNPMLRPGCDAGAIAGDFWAARHELYEFAKAGGPQQLLDISIEAASKNDLTEASLTQLLEHVRGPIHLRPTHIEIRLPEGQ